MAESFSHKWGQKVGEVLEQAIQTLLEAFANEHGLYLDRKGERPARRGKKASWRDINGNSHDLDYVLERNGSPERIGSPVAFIETAWRRYTKHSRNKAQEIQGAILPLVEAHRNSAPFMGAILAGVFTQGALNQLDSLGFSVLYFPYDGIVEAFERVGIDASSDETTAEEEFREKLDAWAALDRDQQLVVSTAILEIHQERVNRFLERLRRSVLRVIEHVFVLPLHGSQNALGSVEAAIQFLQNYDETSCDLPIVSYIVEVRYNTGDRIEGKFTSKDAAIDFLRPFLPPPIQPAT